MPLETVSQYHFYQSRTVDEMCRRRRDLVRSSRPDRMHNQALLVLIGAHLVFISFSVRQSLQLVQGEWNILRMGNPKYIGQCKLVRFKTIYIESVETGASIPLMTDEVINVSLFVIFSYLY